MARIFGFFIGIFGACAILGVFFKIMKWDYYETFMIVGFLGEAAAFVTMGLFELAGAFFGRSPEKPDESAAPKQDSRSRQALDRADEMVASFRKMMEQKVSHDLNVMILALAKEVQRFGHEMREMSTEMEQARAAMQDVRDKLHVVVSGDLAVHAERLGTGMQRLGSEMEHAGTLVEDMRTDLEEMSERFRLFNRPMVTVSDGAEAKIRRLS